MSNKQKQSRREFLKSATAAGVGTAVAFSTAASYARVMGANDRINIGVVGVRSRGWALLNAALAEGGADVLAICDVDANVLSEKVAATANQSGRKPKAEKDYRRMLEIRDIDAVVIATPDHTHAPFAIYGMQADKHIYLEKPCSHNPRESELLVEAQQRYGTVIQMGNQQRSAPTSMEAIQDIRDGAIGRAYMGKAWYSNTRGSIGRGQVADVPDWLNWDLWQGPAPRREYKDNYVHYNWHWFWHWGTGEINNNALHELDICRWALDVEWPERIVSSGGRYHFDDDWEFYDTQTAGYEFPGGKQIVWEGRSCNGYTHYDRGRGVTIHGTEGTILLDRNAYLLYDHDSNLIKQVNERGQSGTTDLIGAGALTNAHMANFFDVIRVGAKQRSPIDEGSLSTTLCHLGNVAQVTGRPLAIDTTNGHIKGDREAMKYWEREYESGWEPRF